MHQHHKPLFILLHGTCLNGAQWAPYRALLEDVAEVSTPDLPGHGVRAADTFTLDAAVRIVHEHVQAAAPGRPVIVGGHSLGGFVAMSYAERHPAALAGLALMGSATEPGGPGAVLYRATARLWELAGPERVQWLHEQTLGRAADGRVWTAIHAQGGESFGAVRDAWTQVMDNCGSHQLRQVRCPVLVLGGAWDQLHLQAARFAAAAPHGQAITAPRRTHQWPLTHPDEVAAILRRWVAELPAHHAGPAAQAPATPTATAGG